MYDVNTEYIQGVPIKSRQANELIHAFIECHEELTTGGFKPALHCIDNETSATLI